MSRLKLWVLMVAVLLLSVLPGTALANKQIYKASLSSANEVPPAVGANATGTMNIGTNPDGSYRFLMHVRGLSGPPTAAHIHGPANATQNASPVVTLCGGGPGSPVSGACPYDAATNSMTLSGTIQGGNLAGIGGGQFVSYLRDGLLYVNVHTAAYPAGEARGQIE